jgi:hypothetical protein
VILPVRLCPAAWVVTYGVLAYWRGRLQFLELAVIPSRRTLAWPNPRRAGATARFSEAAPAALWGQRLASSGPGRLPERGGWQQGVTGRPGR